MRDNILEYDDERDELDPDSFDYEDDECIVRNCEEEVISESGTRQVCAKHLRQADRSATLAPAKGFLPPRDPIAPTRIISLKSLPKWLQDGIHLNDLQANKLPFYTIWTRLIVDTTQVDLSTLLIAYTLARYCRSTSVNERYLYPSIKELVKKSHSSGSTVRRGLSELENLGWIFRIRPEGSVVRYWLDIPDLSSCDCFLHQKKAKK